MVELGTTSGFPNACEHWEQAVLFKSCLSRAQIHSSSLLYLELETLKQRPPTSSKTLLLKTINFHLELAIPLIKKLQYFSSKGKKLSCVMELSHHTLSRTRNNSSARVCSHLCKQSRVTIQRFVGRKQDLPETL